MIHLWIADIIVIYSELQILYLHDSIFGKFYLDDVFQLQNYITFYAVIIIKYRNRKKALLHSVWLLTKSKL